MTNPARTKLAKKATLEALAMAGNYALPEESLWSYVNSMLKPPAKAEEGAAILEDLKKQEWIRAVEDTLDPEMKQWVITELGKNVLASL
jgi:hypothetical protein